MRITTKLTGQNVGIAATITILLTVVLLTLTSNLLKDITENVTEVLTKESYKVLYSGSKSDSENITEVMKNSRADIISLTQSSNLMGLIQAVKGTNEEWNEISQQEAVKTVGGIVSTISTQDFLLKEKLASDLYIASMLTKEKGGFKESKEENQEWQAINQYTKKISTIEIPKALVGTEVISPTYSFDSSLPVVDLVGETTGSTCTIFQRMNDAGDMLRIATNVKKLDGTRAVGTYIPAVNPNGDQNPVLKVVLTGETYRGRAFVVNAWFITSYKPIKNAQGKVVGILYVGVKEQDNVQLQKIIAETKIGQTGYPFVMDNNGVILMHPDKNLVGKNIIVDLKIDVFKEVLQNKSATVAKVVNYSFGGRPKYAVYREFPTWNWIVVGSGYSDEISAKARQVLEDKLIAEFTSLAKNKQVEISGSQRPLYSQIRFIDLKGKEQFKYQKGEINLDKQDKSTATWFNSSKTLKKGEVNYSMVEIAENTGEPELRIIAPVYDGSDIEGFLVLNANWNAVCSIVRSHKYGESGYTYIIDAKGVVVSHPTIPFDKKFDSSDAANVEQDLADKTKMALKATKEGQFDYVFKKVDRFASYQPFIIGDHKYVSITTMNAQEFLGLIDKLKEDSDKAHGELIMLAVIIGVVLFVIAGGIGFMSSRKITKPLLTSVEVIKEMGLKGSLRNDISPAILKRKDEIGDLGNALVTLTDSLKQQVDVAGELAGGKWNITVQHRSVEDELSHAMGQMVNDVSSTLAQVKDTADRLNLESQQISQASMTLSQGATEQAASIEEISASLVEVSSQSSSNAENADLAQKLALNTRSAAEDGNKKMQHMLEAMDDINQSADQIAKIIRTIDDIAFQTNLLALNAAVEAARAGRHGKGFAVVAEEVRSLAGRSAKAAKETADLIENTVAKVANGSQLANQTNISLQEIVESVIKTTDIVSEIACASKEQETGIKQVNIGINQVESATQQNSATSEETSAASQELSGLAANLQQMLTKFELPDELVKQHSTAHLKAAQNAAGILVAWSDDYSVGVDKFDQQHGRLFDIINDLYRAMKQGKANDVMAEILDELIEYTDLHFTEEENIMRQYKYTGLPEQLKQHKKFVDKMKNISENFKSGKKIGTDVLTFLKDWLINHIQKIDKKYEGKLGAYSNKQSLPPKTNVSSPSRTAAKPAASKPVNVEETPIINLDDDDWGRY